MYIYVSRQGTGEFARRSGREDMCFSYTRLLDARLRQSAQGFIAGAAECEMLLSITFAIDPGPLRLLGVSKWIH